VNQRLARIPSTVGDKAQSDRAKSSFVRQCWVHICETAGNQSYYAAGLVLQKGLPYLLIPLLVRLYGAHTYSSYVLFYTSTLMFANLLTLSVPNAIITFWYNEEDKSRLSWTFVLILGVSQFVLGLLLAFPAYLMYGQSFGSKEAILLTVAGFCFATVFNFNTFLTGVCRARNLSKAYFAAQIVASVTLISGVFLLSRWPHFEVLIILFLISLFSQDVYLLKSVWGYLISVKPSFDVRIARSVLAYSLPMLPHLEAVLFCYWVDKYLVRQYFSNIEFTRFTISFQYAFAQAFFAQVFAMHTFPLICQLVTEGNEVKLRAVIRAYNMLLTLLGIAWVGGVLLLQGLGVRLGIDPVGFSLLGAAFLIWNVTGNYINTLWARFRTRPVTGIMLSASVVLVATLAVGCAANRLFICYTAHLISAISALAGLVVLEHSRVRGLRPQPLSAEF
jgi:O-antigen/teichoic acid export membrane protein